MSDPKRLVNEPSNELEKAVLEAGIDVPPPPEHLFERTLVAVGVVASIGAATGAAAASTAAAGASTGTAVAGATGTASKLTAVAAAAGVAKWIVVGALGGVLAGGAIELASPRRDAVSNREDVTAPDAAVSPSRQVPPLATAEAPAQESETIEPAGEPDRAPMAPPRPPSSVAAPAKRSADLAPEVALLDAAQRALDTGDPGRTIALLDQYAAEYPLGRLAPEARVMRIEATARRDPAAAASMARQFLRDSPGSPHAERLRKVDALAPGR
jgi:hypothetical protein